jgi:hypothetical protein
VEELIMETSTAGATSSLFVKWNLSKGRMEGIIVLRIERRESDRVVLL